MIDKEIQVGIFPSSTYTVRLKSFLVHLIKSYLIKLFYKQLPTDEIQCKNLFTLIDNSIISYPNIITYNPYTKTLYTDTILFGSIIYKRREFLISFSRVDELYSDYYVNLITELPNEIYFEELYRKLLIESIRSIDLRGKIIKILFRDNEFVFEFVENFPRISLDDMILPDEVKEDLWDFVYSVAQRKVGLRYLFVGEPGTGKTDTMIALVNEILKISNDIPVIIIESIKESYFEFIFRLLNYLDSAVICLDDLDLVVSTRREKALDTFDLLQFLHNLDGMYLNDNISIIATTNSRELLDLALRRPGRFDLIIEFKPLRLDDYSQIFKKLTTDQKILNVLESKTILNKLASIKATGAFIVTLMKHLKNPKYSNNLSVEAVLKLIDKLYNSFKAEIKTKGEIGFEI